MAPERTVRRTSATKATWLLLVASLLLAPLLAVAQASSPALRDIDLPAQALEISLKQLSERQKVQVIFLTEDVRGINSPAVKGRFTLAEIVERLVAGSGLTASFNRDALVIKPASRGTSQNPTQLALAQTQGAGASDSGKENARREKLAESAVVMPQIMVQGSRTLNMDIRRSSDDVQPYVVFDREVIENSGASSLQDFLKQRLTMNTVAQTFSQASGQNGNVSQINLRGLGTSQTLILIDGRRAASVYQQGTPLQTDINGIPLSAIERIEVLPTTASGIYGGSATGGVVNIVLRRDYSGVEVKTTYDNTFASESSLRRLEFAAGWNLGQGKTNIMLTVSSSQQNQLAMQDRAFYRNGVERILANNPAFFFGTTVPLGATTNIRSSTGVNLTLRNGTPLNSPFTSVPVGYAGPASDGSAGLIANAGKYNFNLASTAQAGGGLLGLSNTPRVDSAIATIRHQLSNDIDAFVEVAGSNNSGKFLSSSLGGLYTIPATAPTNPFSQPIIVRVPNSSGDTSVISTSFNRRIVGGVVVALPFAWKAGVDYSWDRSRFYFSSAPTLSGADVIAMSNGTLNPLRDPNDFPVDFSPYFLARDRISPLYSTMRNATVRVAGAVGELPAGPPQLSALLERRDELFEDGFRFAPTSTFYFPRRSQTVDSIYVEGRVPLVSSKMGIGGVNELELQIAARRDDYSVKGVTGLVDVTSTAPIVEVANKTRSTNPTIGMRYQPIGDLTLRASYGTGFLPPSVQQLVPNAVNSLPAGVATDPRRGNTPTPSFQQLTGGNPNLRPEESESWSGGLVFTPRLVAGLRLSLDYSRIRKTDNITSFLSQQTLDNEALLPGRVVRGPVPAGDPYGVGPVTFLDRTFVNISRAEVEAFDAALDYQWEMYGGRVSVYALATYQPHYKTQLISTVPVVENAGIGSGNPLKLKANAGVTWNNADWTVGWSARYFDSYVVSTTAATILNQVPLLDMKRFGKLLAGASWIGEYGNPDVQSDWAFLSKSSAEKTSWAFFV